MGRIGARRTGPAVEPGGTSRPAATVPRGFVQAHGGRPADGADGPGGSRGAVGAGSTAWAAGWLKSWRRQEPSLAALVEGAGCRR